MVDEPSCQTCGEKLSGAPLRCPRCRSSTTGRPDTHPDDSPPTSPATGTVDATRPAHREPSHGMPGVPPSLAGRFEVVRPLGMGGMGAVHLVRDLKLDREVALKLIRTPSAGLVRRFEREGKLLAALEHQHVVRLYDTGVADGVPYLVMEFVRGRSLSARLAEGRPPVADAVRIAIDVLEGIATAHGRGIVHRDLKPANVFLDDDGRAKVADFGLATCLDPDDAGDETPAGAILGTPGHMAPEQARGEKVGAPADVYAAGVILHQMLTGRPVFSGPDPASIYRAQLDGSVHPPSSVNPGIPSALDELVMRALARDAASRPPADQLAAALADWLDRVTRGRRRVPATGLPALPYKVLEPFDRHDAAVFFGREAEVAELVELVEKPSVRIVLLFGPCGVGKSSLFRAGLLPALDPVRHEPIFVVSGPDPAATIRQSLAARPVCQKLELPSGVLALPSALEVSPRLLLDLMLLAQGASDRTPVLVVDQLEELFTQNPPGSPRIPEFLETVSRLVEAQFLRIRIVLGFRTEFRGHLFSLEERFSHHLRSMRLGDVGEGGLQEAIEGPAALGAYGFSFEAGLARRIAADVRRAAAESGRSSLPLVQIVCRQLHDAMQARGARAIDGALYESALGGVTGALRRYVEDRISKGYGTNAPLARQLMKSLTVKEPGGERFARPLDEEELVAFPDRELARRVLERLVSDHLLVREEVAGGGRRVRLSSEVICPLVDRWVLEPDEAERAARLLERAFRQWHEQGRRPDSLLSGAALDLVVGQRGSLKSLAADERLFVDLSVQRSRRVRLFGLAAALGALVLAACACWALWLRPGSIQITSEPPGALVHFRGSEAGRTPCVLTGLRPGVHSFGITADGHVGQSFDARVLPGVETARRIILEYPYGRLFATSDPFGATCEVRRGRTVVTRGATPLTTEVPAGTYDVAFSHPGFCSEVRPSVRIESNRRQTIASAKLVKDSGFLLVTSVDAGASISVEDPATGRPVWQGTLPMAVSCELPAGSYRTVCTQPGHWSDDATVRVRREQIAVHGVWLAPVRSLGTIRAGAGTYAVPALGDFDADGRLDLVSIVRTGQIEARSGVDGRLLWGVTSGVTPTDALLRGWFNVAPAVGRIDADEVDDVVVGLLTGRVLTLSGRTGAILWEAKTAPIHVPPVLVPGGEGPTAVVATETGAVEARSARDGRLLFRRSIGSPVRVGMATLDAGGDGRLDVAVAGTGQVLALDGSSGALLWSVGTDAAIRSSPATGDLDGDGRPDLALGLENGAVVALSSRGRVLWTRPVATRPIVQTPVVTDLDGDGRPDVAVVAGSGETVAVRGTDGVPIWRSRVDATPMSVAAGDVDSDGVADLLVGTLSGLVTVLSGRTGRPLFDRTVGSERVDVRALDLDSDGVLDVLAIGGGGLVEGLAGIGETVGPSLVTRGDVTMTPAMGDVDGDGACEIVAGSWDGGLHVMSATTGRVVAWPVGLPWTAVALADLDRDALPDIVGLAGFRGVMGVSGRTGRRLWAVDVEGASGMALSGDLDGDRVADVIVGTMRKKVHAVSGAAGKKLWTADLTGNLLASPVTGDLDGDGRREIVAAADDGSIIALSGAGRPLWRWKTNVSLATTPLLVDVDSDGAPDVVENLFKDGLVALSGRDGHPVRAIRSAVGLAFDPVAADLDSDGVADPIAVSTVEPGRVLAFSGRTGRPLFTVELPAVPASGPTIADVDRDGKPEIVTWLRSGRVVVLSRDGGRRAAIDAGPPPFVRPMIYDRAGPWRGRTCDLEELRSFARGPARDPVLVTVRDRRTVVQSRWLAGKATRPAGRTLGFVGSGR